MAKFSAKDFHKLAKKMKQRPRTVIRASVLELSGWVIKDTPVGNPDLWLYKDSNGVYVDYISRRGYPEGYIGGTARGNWIASSGGPASLFDPSRVFGSGAGQIQQKELALAIKNGMGNKFYLTNSTPYIMRLEYEGWSSQAPEGMLRKNVIRFEQAVQNAIAETKKEA